MSRSWRDGLRLRSDTSPKPLAVFLAVVASLLIIQSLVSLAMTGYPAFVLRELSRAQGWAFVVGLPAGLLIAAWTVLRLPPGLLWLTGMPAAVAATVLATLATIGTGDHTAGGHFILLIILLMGGYQLRTTGAWLVTGLVIASSTANAFVLLGSHAGVRTFVVAGSLAVAMTALLSRGRDEQESLVHRYQREAREDALTGARTRLALQEWSSRPVPAAGRGLVLVDLDQFKQLNDRHGHLVGDAMLVHVARVLMDLIGPTDLVCRLGGDEFGVFLTDVDARAVTTMAEAVRTRLATSPLSISEADGPLLFSTRASIGAAHLSARHASTESDTNSGTESSADSDALIALADHQLYQAKSDRAQTGTTTDPGRHRAGP